ncbi:MAG: ROK family protein [Candidatus Cryptobacteroides sp.]
MYENDKRVVMTLDAGGTNFVFSAMRACKEIIEPIRMPAVNDDLEGCLSQIEVGFRMVEAALEEKPVAISFAFPGPADYKAGIIGDLPNFKCFRGGVALGPYLSKKFGIPVFINNDGNLFAYGEALAGFLPAINKQLRDAGNSKQYKNLIGITLGTGFGAGVVIDGQLLMGDNGCGGDVWLMRNKKIQNAIAEESVSVRAVKRVYRDLSNDESVLTPKDIFDIAEGVRAGNQAAAIKSFEELGEVAADGIAHALDIVDGVVVISGGVSAAHKYIMPSLIAHLKDKLQMLTGEEFPCTQMSIYYYSDEAQLSEFLKDDSKLIDIPGSDEKVRYTDIKKTCVAISELGASKAIAIGAYTYALAQLDN